MPVRWEQYAVQIVWGRLHYVFFSRMKMMHPYDACMTEARVAFSGHMTQMMARLDRLPLVFFFSVLSCIERADAPHHCLPSQPGVVTSYR